MVKTPRTQTHRCDVQLSEHPDQCGENGAVEWRAALKKRGREEASALHAGGSECDRVSRSTAARVMETLKCSIT